MPKIKKEAGEITEVVEVVEENKQELLQQEIDGLKQTVLSLTKERNLKTQEAFDHNKEISKLQQSLETQKKVFETTLSEKEKTLETLSKKFNDLAKLFDDYIKGFDDIIELQKLQLRNDLRTQELLQYKIKAFNGEGDKKQ